MFAFQDIKTSFVKFIFIALKRVMYNNTMKKQDGMIKKAIY